MLRYRLITGPLLVAFVVALAWVDERLSAEGRIPAWLVTGLAGLAVSWLAAGETARLLAGAGLRSCVPLARVAAAIALASTLAVTLGATDAGPLAATAWAAILLAGLVRFTRGRTVEGAAAGTAGLLFTAAYAGSLVAFWPLLRIEHGPWFLLGAILVVKSSDIGAYAFGLSLGRRKLIPWLSPGKTREGLAGGVAVAALVGAGLAVLTGGEAVPTRVPVWLGAVAGAAAALVGVIGDLAESLLKREAGVKDSGRLLPGMGGVLDVVDSLLFAGPVLFWLARLAGS